MRWTVGAIYRHKHCLDIDIQILAIRYIGPEYIKLNVAYVNQRNPELVHEFEKNVEIQRRDFVSWSRVC